LILVFDLDDTLFEELTYVRSGFRAVAAFLEERRLLPADAASAFLWEDLQRGRGQNFDRLLQKYGIYSKKLVGESLAVYRAHRPEIKPYPEAVKCLRRLAEYPKYLVTDGNKLAQRKKMAALGIGGYFKYCYLTHCYGRKNAKPVPYCFLKICERERVEPEEIVYIADNPHKDFVGIKPLGMRTIRVLQGNYREIRLAAAYEAERHIESLAELTDAFLTEFFKK